MKDFYISVVIPLYNKEDSIRKTIQSVLEQTFQNFELIIVNDGSTDKSADVLSNIESEKIKLINIPNAGVSFARNTGIYAAKYEYIAFLDADDWWSKVYLEEMVKAIKTYPKNKIFAGGQTRFFKKYTDRYTNEFLPLNNETGSINLFKSISKFDFPLNSSNTIIDKKLFETNGFFRIGQKNHEDHDLWMRLCINEEIIYVNKELSFYNKIEIDTASSGYFKFEDFKMYLKTILEVKANLSGKDKQYFKKFYTRFIILTFIKYQSVYSKNEIKELSAITLNILDFPHKLIISMLVNLPTKKLYEFLKFFRKNYN